MIIFVFFLLFWIGVSAKYSFIIFIILALLVLFFTFKKYKSKIALIGLSLFALGIGVSYIQFDHHTNQFSGVVLESKQNYFLLLSKGEKLYVYEKDNKYEIGDYLSIKGEKENLNFSKVESQFDFSAYLERKGVKYELSPDKIKILFSFPIHIKQNRNLFLSHFNKNTRQVVGSLLFSDYDSSNVIDNLEALHISRLVNMSGIYLYTFLSIIEFFLSFLLKKKWAQLAAHGVLLPYYIFTFPRFTVIRLVIMQLLRWINKYPLKEKFSHLDILGIGGLFFLMIDYHLGYQVNHLIS